MKDLMKPCQHTLSDDVEYKEVVVIGNGPSGLVTSFMLAGNVPYLKQIPEDLPIDEMLRARLSNVPPGQSLYEADLLELAQGLEGRSQNPIPLLMDNLLRPCADLGIEAEPLIEWKHEVDKQIPHIVLGSGPPGGAWRSFPARVRTLSPLAWLTLPPHSPLAWLTLPPHTLPHAAPRARLPAAAVADYYHRYVRATKLKRYFRTGAVVTSVRRAPAQLYCVAGFDKSEGRPFRYMCRRVVLACGAGDRPNTLEPSVAKHAMHSLADLERALQNLDSSAGPVLVVGSGVSAADAVCLCSQHVRSVVHLHRTPAAALAKLEPDSYPDYCQVYKMMCDGERGNYPNYTSYPNHVIVEVTPEGTPADRRDPTKGPKRVKLLNVATNKVTEITVSIITVLIGSKPDLFFLQTNFNLNCIELESDCIKCAENQSKKKIEDSRQWFLKEHWHYFKTLLGQSIQSCKSRLNNTEINGNTNGKCVLPDCNKRLEKKCSCNNLISKLENGVIKTCLEDKCNCDSLETNTCPSSSYSNGVGFGVDPESPVDGRGNPIAIDKSTHELLNAPKGVYALGPLTGDNFVRFIPGGALALVADIHKEKTAE